MSTRAGTLMAAMLGFNQSVDPPSRYQCCRSPGTLVHLSETGWPTSCSLFESTVWHESPARALLVIIR